MHHVQPTLATDDSEIMMNLTSDLQYQSSCISRLIFFQRDGNFLYTLQTLLLYHMQNVYCPLPLSDGRVSARTINRSTHADQADGYK